MAHRRRRASVRSARQAASRVRSTAGDPPRSLPNVTRGQRRPPRVPRDPVFRVRGLISQGVRDTNVPTAPPRRRIRKSKRSIRQQLQIPGSRFTRRRGRDTVRGGLS